MYTATYIDSKKQSASVGTDDGTKMDEFSEKFQWGRGEEGHFQSKNKFVADFEPLNRFFSDVFRKDLQHDFPKMWVVGGQRPFGTFLKIHSFWYRHPSPYEHVAALSGIYCQHNLIVI